ncbi:MAG: amidohydrolase, partial [Thermodesulfobacteriota bacterium]
MDAVFLNGNIITMRQDVPDATAFAVVNGRFYAVGDDDNIRTLTGPDTRVVDLDGKTVLPGFIESHNHMSIFGILTLQADCSPGANQSITDVKKRLHKKAQTVPAGQWVKGWGYDDTLIADKRHLTCIDLDEAAPDHPVMVLHVTGHLAYANSKALVIAGIGPDTPQPAGGEIHKNADGTPSGLLMEPGAINLVNQHIPPYTADQFKRVLPEAMAHYNRYGITSTHDAAIGYSGEERLAECRAYRELEAEGRLSLRVYLTIVEKQYQKLTDLGLGTGFGSEFLKLGSVKLFQDGSIQALTAALTEGYHNNPDVKGEFILPHETLEDLVVKYHQAGLQLAIHANGDRAIESVLKALEKAQDRHHRDDHRHMIIHCQTASDDHIQRMKKIGAIPSYFANHVYYWGDRHEKLFLGPERAARIDPLGSSLK